MSFPRRHPVLFFLILFLIPSFLIISLLIGRFAWPAGIAWLVAVNVSAFLFWGFDKVQSRAGGRRVPEMALHVMALVGATPASFLCMKLFRHKTMKRHFMLLYVVFFVAQVAFVVWLWQRGGDGATS